MWHGICEYLATNSVKHGIMSSTFDNSRAGTTAFAPTKADWLQDLESYQTAVSALKTWRHRSDSYHDVYDLNYFDTLERVSARNAPVVAQSVVEHLNPVRVVDLGCGTGGLLENLRSLGVKTIGADFSEIALAYCEKRGLDVRKIDFTDANAVRCAIGRFDLAISLDVAHQLPKAAAGSHVAYLCHHADTVLFSAPACATDRLPKCVRPIEFWSDHFERQGFALDYALSSILKAEWLGQKNISSRHHQPLVYQRIKW